MIDIENGDDLAADAALLAKVMEGEPQGDADITDVAESVAPEPEKPERAEPRQVAPGAPPSPQEPMRENRVPLNELLEERRARQALERQIAEMNGRMAAFEGMTRQSQAPQQPQQEPDYLEDPAGFVRHQFQPDFERQQQVLMFNARLIAEAVYGKQDIGAAVKAFDDAQARGAVHPFEAQRIMNSPNPFAEALTWHRQQAVISETGGDLKAYRAKVAAELRSDPEFVRSVIDAARQQAAANQTGTRPVINLPSIAKVGAAALSSEDEPQTDADLLARAMSRKRGSDGRFR